LHYLYELFHAGPGNASFALLVRVAQAIVGKVHPLPGDWFPVMGPALDPDERREKHNLC